MKNFKDFLKKQTEKAQTEIEKICISTLSSDFSTSDEIENILERIFAIRADLEEINSEIKEL